MQTEDQPKYVNIEDFNEEQKNNCIYLGSIHLSLENLSFHLTRMLNQQSCYKIKDLINRFDICIKGLHFTALNADETEFNNFDRDFESLANKVTNEIIPECRALMQKRKEEAEAAKKALN